jgi:integration host factor subunit beta
MIKSELIQVIASKQPNLNKVDVEAAVNCIFNRINEELGRGGRIEIRGFGTFSVRQHNAKMGRNPRTGEVVSVPRKNSVHFKPGSELRERANASASGHRII